MRPTCEYVPTHTTRYVQAHLYDKQPNGDVAYNLKKIAVYHIWKSTYRHTINVGVVNIQLIVCVGYTIYYLVIGIGQLL